LIRAVTICDGVEMHRVAFPGVERRMSARSAVRSNRALLEWWEGVDCRSASARLIDISSEGARLQAEEPLPLEQTVWCQLVEPAPTDWVKMHVTWRGDAHEAGVVFQESCPDDFYLAATLGVNPSAVIREPSVERADRLD